MSSRSQLEEGMRNDDDAAVEEDAPPLLTKSQKSIHGSEPEALPPLRASRGSRGLNLVSSVTRSKVERLAHQAQVKRALSSAAGGASGRNPSTSSQKAKLQSRGFPMQPGQGDPYSALRRAPPMGSAALQCFLEPCVEDAVTCDGALELTISGFTLMKHFSDKNIFYVVVSAPPFKVVTAPAMYYPFDKSRAAKARRTRLSKMYGRQKGVVDFDLPQCFRMLVLAGTVVRLEVWKERLGVVDEGPYAACTLQIPKRNKSSVGGENEGGRALSVVEGSQGGERDAASSKFGSSNDGENNVVGSTSYRLLEPHTDGHTRGTIQVELEMMPKPGFDKESLEVSGGAMPAEEGEKILGNQLNKHDGALQHSYSRSSAPPPPPPSSDAFKKITTAEMLRLVCSDSSGVFRLDAALGRAHSRCLVLALVSCHIAEGLLQGTIEAVKTETPRVMGWLTETAWEVVPGREIMDGEDWAGGYARHLQRVVEQSPGLDLHDLLALLSADLVGTALPDWSTTWEDREDARRDEDGHENEWEAVDGNRARKETNPRDGGFVGISNKEDRNRRGQVRGDLSTASTIVTRTAELLRGLGRFAIDGISVTAEITTGADPFVAKRDVLVTTAAAARRKRGRNIVNRRLERLKSVQADDSSWFAPFKRFAKGGDTELQLKTEESFEEEKEEEEKEHEHHDNHDEEEEVDELFDPAWDDDVCGTRRLGVEADPLLKIDIMNRLRRISLENASRGRAFEMKWRSPTRIQRDAMRGLRSKRWLPPPPPAREPPPPNNKHRLHRQVFVIAAIASLETPVPLFDAEELRQPSLSCGSLMDYASELELGACEKCGAALCELRDAMWYQIRCESARVRSAEGPQNIAQRLLFEHFKARHVVGADSDEERLQPGQDGDTGEETAGSDYGGSYASQLSMGSMRSSMRDILSGVSRAASSTKTKMRRMRRRERSTRAGGAVHRDGDDNNDDDESSSDDDSRMLRSTTRSGIRNVKPPSREQRVIRARETYNPDDYD